MSSKNRQSNNNNFSVTYQRDGGRTFRGGHDDRFYHAGSNYNHKGRGGRGRGRGRRGFKNFNQHSSRFRYALLDNDDGDEFMGGASGGSSHRSYRGNQRGRSMRRSGRGRMAGPSAADMENQWYRVVVPFGARLGKDELFKLIQESADIEIPFQNYHTLDQRAVFNVQGASYADTIRELSRRIEGLNGQKIVLMVSESHRPKNVNFSDDQKEKLKLSMSDRYEASVQLLNLNNLHADEKLKKENIFMSLNKQNVMEAVTKIVAEHIPEMTSLDLSQNRLSTLRDMPALVKAAPGVVSLNLGKNYIRSLDELNHIKGWANITELILDGNELCNSYSNQTSYISAVRKKFPKVTKLDGKELPPPIALELDTLPLPPTQDSYFLNDEIKKLLVTFVKEYFTIFDSDNRKNLMAAYHENAQFSCVAVKNPTLDKQGEIGLYMRESRNLKRIGHIDSDKLAKKVKVGPLAIVAALDELPKTTHDLNSFKVDILTAKPSILSFVLQGSFKETASRADKPIIRSFSRTFVTTPAGAGVSIINDMLTISNAGVEQSRNAFKEGAPTPSSSPASSSQTAPTIQIPSPAEQKQMVDLFVQQSGMNADFSLKCLQENAWDYQRAAINFQELKAQGKIPDAAFIK